MKKFKNFEKIEITFIGGILIAMLSICILTSAFNKSNLQNATTYSCDYHTLNIFKTVIDINKGDKNYATIEGKIAKIVTDPLTMKDKEGNTIGKAGDEYHLVSQDSHSISLKEGAYIEMTGNFKLLGEEYTIYDSEENLIGKASFNLFGTNGVLTDKDGNIIAEYNSGWLRKDYDVTIKNEAKIDSDAILLVFASYASDFDFDNK